MSRSLANSLSSLIILSVIEFFSLSAQADTRSVQVEGALTKITQVPKGWAFFINPGLSSQVKVSLSQVPTALHSNSKSGEIIGIIQLPTPCHFSCTGQLLKIVAPIPAFRHARSYPVDRYPLAP